MEFVIYVYLNMKVQESVLIISRGQLKSVIYISIYLKALKYFMYISRSYKTSYNLKPLVPILSISLKSLKCARHKVRSSKVDRG